jgi:hypothetical protein
MPYPNEHAVRVKDPGLFIPDSFRSKEIKPGIRIIIGKLKSGTSMVTQAYRFSSDSYTIEEVRSWLKDNNVAYMKIEPASEKEDNKLEHIGVKGMRWGVRKSINSGRSSGKKGGSKESPDYSNVSKLRKKKIKSMSNEEMERVVKRMSLEKRYKEINPSKVKRGSKAVGNAFTTVGQVAGVAASIVTLATLGKKFFDYYNKVKGGG